MGARNEVIQLSKLICIDAATLMERNLPPIQYCVHGLIPQGLVTFSGPAKVGKSLLVLDLARKVSAGEKFWGFSTERGTVLYLALEDTLVRLQNRLDAMTENVYPDLYLSVMASPLSEGLVEQIREFADDHESLSLVIIDVFQKVRDPRTEVSYANDYNDVTRLKDLADSLQLTVLVVHHTRKEKSEDVFDMVTGSTGITGAADANLVLLKKDRNSDEAVLSCTGRDIPQRQLTLRLNEGTLLWEKTGDSLERPDLLFPAELKALVQYMQHCRTYYGGNTELAQAIQPYCQRQVDPRCLKREMNRWAEKLDLMGVTFQSRRSNGQRLVSVRYESDGSDDSDDKTGAPDLSSLASLSSLPEEGGHRVRVRPEWDG